jgi:hypothetical protein
MRRLRLPLLALSLLFLGASLSILLWSNRGGRSLITYLHEPEQTDKDRAAEEKARHENNLAYAKRLRADGLARVRAGDYENALTRLDDAARIDPGGEQLEQVVTARQSIGRGPVVHAGQ